MEPENTQGEGSGAPVAQAAPVTPAPVASMAAFDQKDVTDNKYIAALAYIWILFLVPLLVKKESPFAQFHAKQGLVMCVASLIFSVIPIIGWLANVGLFIIAIIAIVKTLSGEAWEIPLVKDAVKKLNI